MYSVDTPTQLPKPQGLYDPANEHDACGIGFVVNIQGQASHDIVLKGLEILVNLAHHAYRRPVAPERPRHPPEDFSEHSKGRNPRNVSLKGGDPAAGSPTATLLRLHPSR